MTSPPILSAAPPAPVLRFSPTALRKARHRAGLSRAALARAADLSFDTIRHCERGGHAHGPGFDTVCRLACALGVSLDDLTDRVVAR